MTHFIYWHLTRLRDWLPRWFPKDLIDDVRYSKLIYPYD